MSPQESIAHYRIVSKIGEGGMGAVYRATDGRLNLQVAIKVLPEAFAQDRDRMARFEREAQVLASLHQPSALAGRRARAVQRSRQSLRGLRPRDAAGCIATAPAA